MASSGNAVLCALVATAFWTFLGFAVARHLLPRTLAVGASAVVGWAVHSALTLPLFGLIGFGSLVVAAVGAVCLVLAAVSLRLRPLAAEAAPIPPIPAWAIAAAALLALGPTAAILPKISAGAVHLADPIFDHSKIAIVDAMIRSGLPPINPIFGAAGAASRLVYYYLWHFGAAQLALPLGATGWEGDIALTFFTAFASLLLMMGVAVWLANSSAAAIWVVLLAAAGSLRTTFDWIFGSYQLEPLLSSSTGFAGWLFQASWVPQHLMSAACVVVALLLIARAAAERNPVLPVALALVVAAGFESSTYVGGVTFAIAAVAATVVLLMHMDAGRRPGFIGRLVVAAVLAVALVSPFVVDQLGSVAARGDVRPVVVHSFEVLGTLFPEGLRRLLDLPAYWLILLPIEFPAAFVAGVLALAAMLRSTAPPPQKIVLVALAALAGTGLTVSWLLASTLGDNNDLALRAVLPAILVLIASAAAGLVLVPRRRLIAAAAIGGLVLSLPDAVRMIRSNVAGHPAADAAVFAQTPELWQAVRRIAPPDARVANNPLFLQDLTPWPANISWALLADRSSCFAGRELALAFAPLDPARREAVNAQFVRVFGGEAAPDDVHELATRYGCDTVVLVPQDRAWANDPFASSPDYRLADSRDGRWRIYVLRR